MPKEFSYTIEEVSQLLKVSKLTLYDWLKKGIFQYSVSGGK